MGYYISFVTTQNGQTLKSYSNKHIRGLKSLVVCVDQQLIEAKLVWEKCESNSSCLPHWSLDSHTICSSYSALFTTHTAEDDKASMILLLISFFCNHFSCFLTCPWFTFCLFLPMIGLSLSLTFCPSSWAEPWGTKSNAAIYSSAATVRVCDCRSCTVGQSVNVKVIIKWTLACASTLLSFVFSTSTQQILSCSPTVHTRKNDLHPYIHSLLHFFGCIQRPGQSFRQLLLFLKSSWTQGKVPTTC